MQRLLLAVAALAGTASLAFMFTGDVYNGAVSLVILWAAIAFWAASYDA